MSTKKCPFCAEEIQLEAVKCKHCGSMLGAAQHPAGFGPQPQGGQSYWDGAQRDMRPANQPNFAAPLTSRADEATWAGKNGGYLALAGFGGLVLGAIAKPLAVLGLLVVAGVLGAWKFGRSSDGSSPVARVCGWVEGRRPWVVVSLGCAAAGAFVSLLIPSFWGADGSGPSTESTCADAKREAERDAPGAVRLFQLAETIEKTCRDLPTWQKVLQKARDAEATEKATAEAQRESELARSAEEAAKAKLERWPGVRHQALERLAEARKKFAKASYLEAHVAIESAHAFVLQYRGTAVERTDEFTKLLAEVEKERAAIDVRAKPLREAAEQKAREERAVAEMRGIQPKTDPATGVPLAVKKHMVATAHDPSSLSYHGCTRPRVYEGAWLVTCEIRGKNMFGALILQTREFAIIGESEDRIGTVIASEVK